MNQMVESRRSIKISPHPLPEGYSYRPARFEDVPAAAALFNACSQELNGEDEVNEEHLGGEWRTPGFKLEHDTRVVFDPHSRLVGYYEVWDGGHPHVSLFVWGRVHPDHVGRGIGSHLVSWAEARSRRIIPLAPPEARVILWAFVLSKNRSAGQLLRDQGFQHVRHNLRMVIELNGSPPEPVWPEGITVRTYCDEADLAEVMHTVRSAFSDHWGYVQRPFEEEYERMLHFIREDPLFDPSLWFLAVADGQIVATSLCRPYIHEDPEMGWVGTLGVLRPYRRHGLGMAMLQHSFAEFYRRGVRKVGLGVDAQSLTGATHLYEKAGMHSDPNHQYSMYEKELRPGVDLTTTSTGE